MTKLTTQLNELKTLKATFPRGTDGRVTGNAYVIMFEDDDGSCTMVMEV